MKTIDFDAKLQRYLSDWMQQNRSRYDQIDQMEADIPDAVMQWRVTPAAYLGGLSPEQYFKTMEDPQQLVELLAAYDQQQIGTPDLLLERLEDLYPATEDALCALALDDGCSEALRLTAMNLLLGQASDKLYGTYLDWITQESVSQDLLEVACEALGQGDEAVAEQILRRLEGPLTDSARELLAAALIELPVTDAAFAAVLKLFRQGMQPALLAAYLGASGRSEALDALKARAADSQISYLDYIEVKNAIAMLGEEIDDNRDFSGDAAYEALKQMK